MDLRQTTIPSFDLLRHHTLPLPATALYCRSSLQAAEAAAQGRDSSPSLGATLPHPPPLVSFFTTQSSIKGFPSYDPATHAYERSTPSSRCESVHPLPYTTASDLEKDSTATSSLPLELLQPAGQIAARPLLLRLVTTNCEHVGLLAGRSVCKSHGHTLKSAGSNASVSIVVVAATEWWQGQ